MSYEGLKALIARLGVHPQLGPEGEGWGIEQNPHELATFLMAVPSISTVLEIGSGYRAGLAKFMAEHLGWQVTSLDVKDYGHEYPGVTFLNLSKGEYPPEDVYYDLVVIDGDHSYESVQADYEFWGEYALKVIMFHDIAGLRQCDGVAKFWRKIAHTRSDNLRKGFHEVIADGPERAGIGWQVL